MNRERRLNLLFLVLLFTALLLTVTTYAWFSTNRIFEIESFDIHVATRGGLEISSDAINWKGVIGIVDLMDSDNTYQGNINQIPNSIKPVSSGGDVENGMLKIYYGEVEQGLTDQKLKATRNIESRGYGENTNSNFLAFDIFFKTSFRRKLTIDPNSGIEFSSGNSGMENAFRVAFLNQGNVGENVTQAQNLNNANRAYIWETNYDVHAPSALEHAKNIYEIDTTLNNAQRLDYYGITNEIPSSLGVNVKDANSNSYPNNFKLVNIDLATKKNETEFKEIFLLEKGITKVRVYIWLEGQDVDCENNSSVGSVEINIQFEAEPY